MHTRATAPCCTQQDIIMLKQIEIDMPRVTGEEGTPIDLT